MSSGHCCMYFCFVTFGLYIDIEKKCLGDSMKKEIFASKIEQFHMSMCKQILGVKKFTNNIKVKEEHYLK